MRPVGEGTYKLLNELKAAGMTYDLNEVRLSLLRVAGMVSRRVLDHPLTARQTARGASDFWSDFRSYDQVGTHADDQCTQCLPGQALPAGRGRALTPPAVGQGGPAAGQGDVRTAGRHPRGPAGRAAKGSQRRPRCEGLGAC